MKVLFTGATGVIGRRAVPELMACGHEVSAGARNEADEGWLSDIGAKPVEVDLFDPASVSDAVVGADAVIHMATAIPPQAKMTKRESWAVNDRLRSEATSLLVDAALSGGVEVFIQQSISFVYADGGGAWLDEGSPVETVWDVLDSALEAERQVARFTRNGGRGVVLRYSSIYGPGSTSADYIASVVARKLPLVGKGENYVSHLHVDDAARAITFALDAPAGLYNVTDDVPVTKREELASLAATIGAKEPRSVPRWLAKRAAGPAASMLTVSHRVSNRRFKAATGWEPRFPTVLEGWSDAAAEKSTLG